MRRKQSTKPTKEWQILFEYARVLHRLWTTAPRNWSQQSPSTTRRVGDNAPPTTTRRGAMKTGLILCGVFLLLAVLVGALGHYEGAKHGAAITTEVQQAVVHTASLTTEEALVEGGKKDATPGWRLTSALYDKKNNEVCYTYSGSGHGILYEEVYRESGAWIVYHSNGLEEFSNGRTNYWEAGDNPCTRMKDIAKILGNKYKIVDLLLTPAEKIGR